MVCMLSIASFSVAGSIDRKALNETKVGEEYFRDLLRKVTQGEPVEGSGSKIINSESELRAALCHLYNKNNETDAVFDEREMRIILEMRKLNFKLITIERKLDDLKNHVGDLFREEMKAFKYELLRNTSNGNGL